jgi:antagonist of KipI
MSLKIIKAGILDTVQDLGRYGYQQLGINPSGCMDRFAARVVNMLVGNDVNEAVIEMHFPAATVLFEDEALIATGGGNFSATINGEEISLWQPVIVSKNSILQFQKWKNGARCYLALREKLAIPKWLNSYSTNLKAGCGGYRGRALQKDDTIPFSDKNGYKKFLNDKDHMSMPWKADVNWSETFDTIAAVKGNEWDWLSESSQEEFSHEDFVISSSADRMGYKLEANLVSGRNEELVSAAVSFGTIQLLPNGKLIVLMADHQTTGGYPRVAHIIAADLSRLAQMHTAEMLRFRMTTQDEAEKLLLQQEQHLIQLQNACNFRLKAFLHE